MVEYHEHSSVLKANGVINFNIITVEIKVLCKNSESIIHLGVIKTFPNS